MKTSEFKERIRRAKDMSGCDDFYVADNDAIGNIVIKSNNASFYDDPIFKISSKKRNCFVVNPGDDDIAWNIPNDVYQLVIEYASTPIKERKDETDDDLSVKEMIQQEIDHNNDLLKEYFNPEIITKWYLGQPYQQMRLQEVVQEITKDVAKIKDKKPNWFK